MERHSAPKRWTSVARILAVALVATNNLAIRPEITGSGPEIRMGYPFAVAFIVWVWWFGKPSWLPQRRGGVDYFARYLVGLLIVSTVSGILTLGLFHLPLSFFTALGVIVLYSIAIYTLMRMYKITELLLIYLNIVKYAVVMAGVQQLAWLLFKIDTTGWIRAIGFSCRFGGEEAWFVRSTSWWQEPAHFAAFLLLGVLLAVLPAPDALPGALKLTRPWRIAIIGTFALTFSTSVIPIIIFIILAFATDRRRQWALLVICTLVPIWIMSSHIIFERLQAIQTLDGNLVDTNLSLWAVASNFLASSNYLTIAPLGIGVGNHIIAYDAWLQTTRISELSADQLYLNARDAGSMVARLLSEFGLPSIFIWIYLLSRSVALAVRGHIRSRVPEFAEYLAISAFLTLCLRQGSYSLFDPWFFLLVMLQARNTRTRKIQEVNLGSTLIISKNA